MIRRGAFFACFFGLGFVSALGRVAALPFIALVGAADAARLKLLLRIVDGLVKEGRIDSANAVARYLSPRG